MTDKIEQLKAALPSIPDMVPGLVRETDSSLCGPCVLCGGTDRFVYKTGEEKFFCRQCRPKGGDVIDLYRLIHNIALPDLFKQYGINGNNGSKPKLKLQAEPANKKTTYSQQDRWNNILKNTNLDPIYRLAKRRGISKKIFLKAYNENKIRFVNHNLKNQEEVPSVACQYCELDGSKKVLAIQMLAASVNDKVSYSDTENKNKVFTYGSENKEGCFFQVGETVDQANTIILFESVINAFSCAECLPDVCCLAIGSSDYTKKVRALRKYRDKGSQIICFFDNDKDGQKAVDSVSIILGEKTKTVVWPNGTPSKYDINDLLKAGKQKQIIDMIENAEPVKIDSAGTEEGVDDQIDELNKTHAIIKVGGKVRILDETEDVTGCPDIQFLTEYDFKVLYANRKVPNPLTGKGQPKQIQLSTAWLSSPKRREYQGVIFEPQIDNDKFYNLFRGLDYEPVKGDWSLFRTHIFENICLNNLQNFNWLIAWLARIVQDPGGEKPGTAVVLRGDRGTGKNVFAEIFGEIFGHHFKQVTNSKQVTGRFNAHLKDCILLYMDEAWFAGDKSSEGVLKGLITSNKHPVEFKGKDVLMMSNHVNCIIASNNEWVVPVGNKERRFFLLDVSNAHIQNHKYFKAISDQMYKQGGISAMLHDLLSVDVSKHNLREAPKTSGLFYQYMKTLSSVDNFWHERLCLNDELGDFDPETNTSNMIAKSKLYDQYVDYCKKINEKYIEKLSVFSKNLKKYCDFKVVQRTGSDQNRYRCYSFPSNSLCRKQFSDHAGMEVEWEPIIFESEENDVDKI